MDDFDSTTRSQLVWTLLALAATALLARLALAVGG